MSWLHRIRSTASNPPTISYWDGKAWKGKYKIKVQ